MQEQIRILQDELGDDDVSPELDKLKEEITQGADARPAVRRRRWRSLPSFGRPRRCRPESSGCEATSTGWFDVPWHKNTKDNLDVGHVRRSSTRTTSDWRSRRSGSSNTSPC